MPEKNVATSDFKDLNIEKMWTIPSQSEMKNGQAFGCNDGHAILIELSDKNRYKYSLYMCPDLQSTKDSTFGNVEYFIKTVNKLAH